MRFIDSIEEKYCEFQSPKLFNTKPNRILVLTIIVIATQQITHILVSLSLLHGTKAKSRDKYIRAIVCINDAIPNKIIYTKMPFLRSRENKKYNAKYNNPTMIPFLNCAPKPTIGKKKQHVTTNVGYKENLFKKKKNASAQIRNCKIRNCVNDIPSSLKKRTIAQKKGERSSASLVKIV
nr:hypothetical protein [uncultured Bacteroides sp.]